MKTRSNLSASVALALSGVMLLMMGSPLVAQVREYGDRRSETTEQKRSGLTASSSSRGPMRANDHVGDSPWPTPTPTDTTFVVDTGEPGLDTQCQFRSEGSLKFKLKVTRYVGAVNGEGKLSNPTQLINNHVISRTATVMMPAFDVDFNAATQAPDQPERDRILFNGEPVADLGSEGYLDGENQRWRINSFTVDIDKVKFAQLDSGGGAPTPGENEIEILIDQANIANNKELWCTSIDWAALSFKALDPIVMVHGNGEDGSFWTRLGFTSAFQQAGVPYDISISMGKPGHFISENAAKLFEKIPAIANKFGVKHVHIVAHSKGGLDSRAFLKLLVECDLPLAVMSLTTLSTPHHGSVLADYVRDVQTANASTSHNEDRVKFFQRWGGAFDDGRKNLTTRFVRGFNRENLPLPRTFTVDGEETGINYFAFSGDANADNSFDENGEPTISSGELIGTGFLAVVGHFLTGGGNDVYRTLYHVYSTTLSTDDQGRDIVEEISNEQAGLLPQPNDMLVTRYSAAPEWFMALPEKKKNHATMADQEMGGIVYQLISSIRPLE